MLLPPIPGMMVAEYFIVKRSKETKSINWVAILTWVISTVVGEIAIIYNFLVPAIVSMVVSFILYALLSKALDPKLNKDVG